MYIHMYVCVYIYIYIFVCLFVFKAQFRGVNASSALVTAWAVSGNPAKAAEVLKELEDPRKNVRVPDYEGLYVEDATSYDFC